ncbi:TetR/AcrR family transcriptional regulator [Methylocystis sp. ATCC 49242]|uniref:TetR/AcrR family transcriptional regulator n=1 Tax=Methylocystis sp. ATCC 49242 TaxID=622637 RepID=UPI0001F86ED1|nr:TetR/AcrR family transcriptional regulator [Methylocystis sp. ATCC 49242]
MTNPRDRVVDATLSLAARRDFGDVSLTDIAHEAGLSLADLRDLFPSKGAILGGFSRRIDRKVLDAVADHPSTDAARDRLYDVLRRRLEALEPYRDALASIARWASRDPLMRTALNRETVNSMRFMLEAADIDCDGPVGALKLQGLAFAWDRVLDAWFKGDFTDGLSALDTEIARGERYVEHAEELSRMTKPLRDLASRFFDMSGLRSRQTADDDFPHPHA